MVCCKRNCCFGRTHPITLGEENQWRVLPGTSPNPRLTPHTTLDHLLFASASPRRTTSYAGPPGGGAFTCQMDITTWGYMPNDHCYLLQWPLAIIDSYEDKVFAFLKNVYENKTLTLVITSWNDSAVTILPIIKDLIENGQKTLGFQVSLPILWITLHT
ncbi:hypothetical protein Hanom_Chr09g00772791 [Helianthus anomalus]